MKEREAVRESCDRKKSIERVGRGGRRKGEKEGQGELEEGRED